MSSWTGLRDNLDAFERLGAVIYGVAADSPEELRRLRDEHDLPFTLLSDPELMTVDALKVPVSSATSFYTALPIHPELRAYPRKAFLQPALFVWKGEDLVYEWRQSEKITNMFGALRRPTTSDVLDIARRYLRQ